MLMIGFPRVRLAHGSLVTLTFVALGAAAVLVSQDTPASAEQPDVPGIQNALERAQSVIVATPRSVQSAWQENEFGDRIIQSAVLLEVSETIKGRPERSRWLRVEGGTVDGVTLEVSGEPEVAVGRRAVLILDSVRPDLDRFAAAEESMLELDEQDLVRGTGIKLDDIRRHVRGAGR
jgi:hypothetical protein